MTTTPGSEGYSGPERRSARVRRIPAAFVSHGLPDSIFDTDYGNALRRFAAHQGPLAAIVVVSAHWESLRPIRVTRCLFPQLLYDFAGMPSRVDRVSFQCRGNLALADRVIAEFERAGIRAVADASRGLDHGAWVPLSLAFPSGRVPVVQVSLPLPAEPQEIIDMGRALAPLRNDRILLLGSGGIVHNLHRMRFSVDTEVPDPWALGFDMWVREQAGRLDLRALAEYRRRAPHALESVPTPEHFEPLLFVLGSASTGDRIYDIYDGFRHGSLSMRSLALAGRRRDDQLGLSISGF